MNKRQRKVIEQAGFDPEDFFETNEGWSHRGFVAWQLELVDESKHVDTEDGRIARVLRVLDEDC